MNFTPKLFAVLLLFFTLNVSANHPTKLELLDIFDLEHISDPQISPDGSQIIYVRHFRDIMTDQSYSNLWIIDYEGTQNRPLTSGNQKDYEPRWSHDGSMITFKSNKQDDGIKLYLMWPDTRDITALTQTQATPGRVSWSYDNKQLAFTMFVPKQQASVIKMPAAPDGATWNDPPVFIDELNYRADGAGYLKKGAHQIFILSIEGGTPRQLTFSDYDHAPFRLSGQQAPIWSKDGQHLYFSANLRHDHAFMPLNMDIYRISIANGELKQLTDRFGPDTNPVLSPDGSLIASTGFDDKFLGHQGRDIYVMDTDGSNKRALTQNFDRDVSNPQWASNGEAIYFQYHEHGDTKIGKVTLDGQIEALTGNLGGISNSRPYNAATYTVSENSRFAYTLGNPKHPAELGTWTNHLANRLTRVNNDLFSFRKLGQVEEIWWKSSYDQRDIQGWLVTPPDFDPQKKYPLILEIHGGPFASYGDVFASEIQMFAAAGYVVLYANPRGSTGYGQDFANLIHHNYPGNDYDDLMSGVDAVIEKGFIDTENLFVTGGSGGGVLTAWITSKTDRFRAAVVSKPVINWYSFVLYADLPVFFYKYWFPAKPWEAPEHYMERSPLAHVDNVTTPTLLLTGEQDYRTPIAESEQYYTALKLQGVETALVRIPNSSHSMENRPSMLVAKLASILGWFEQYRQD